MKRIQEKNINTPEEYDRIFSEQKEVCDEFDLKRWNVLLRFFRGGKLADFGCFDSYLCNLAKQRYPNSEIWGIDIAEKIIAFMKQQYPNINFEIMSVYNITFPNEYFNYITMGELLEHLEKPELVIKEAVRALKPGGVLAISVPLEETGIGEVDKERHLWSFCKEDMIDLLKYYGIVHFWVLRSERYPKYEYHFPILITWLQKYAKID